MWTNSFSHILADGLSAIFAIAAIIDLVAARHIRARFRHWRYPRQFYRVMGMLQLFTAFFLAAPPSRFWGVILAGFITFFWVVTLLNHRQWRLAVAGMLMMMALVPASLVIH